MQRSNVSIVICQSVICVAFASTHLMANPKFKVNVPVPEWAEEIDRSADELVQNVSFESSGSPDRSILFSHKVLAAERFEQCKGNSVSWHDFGAVRNGQSIRAHRLVEFFFRYDPPSIAVFEVLSGDPNYKFTLQIRELPSSGVVSAQRDLICGK